MRDTPGVHASEIHPRARLVLDTCDLLAQAVLAAGREAHRRWRRRRRRGQPLRPRPETPCWDALATLAAARITRYGDQARLGRTLGVPRQRIHEYLVAWTASPDAERTLRLLVWLATPVARPGPRRVSRAP